MPSPVRNSKWSCAFFLALDLPVLLLVLGGISTSFNAVKQLTAVCALSITLIVALVFRKLNQKKYERHEKLQAKKFAEKAEESPTLQRINILPFLHTLLLPLFLSSLPFCRSCGLAEVLLFGAILCCILEKFMFDTKAVLTTACVALYLISFGLGNTLDTRTIVFTIIQGVICHALSGDLGKSLAFNTKVLFAQLMTIGVYLFAGGYNYPMHGPLNPFLDLFVYTGYFLLVFLLVLMAEEIANYHPHNCMKYLLVDMSRFSALVFSAFRFSTWIRTENGYNGNITPLAAIVQLLSTKEAALTVLVGLLVTVICLAPILLKKSASDSLFKEKLSTKPFNVTLLRKVPHFVVCIVSVVAMYLKQRLLLGLLIYCAFVLAMALELLRFYGFLAPSINLFQRKVYKIFGEAADRRVLVTSHVGLLLACGIPLWMAELSTEKYDYIAASLGLITVGLADSMAAIVGRHFSKVEGHNRSVQGSAAFFITSSLALLLAFICKTKAQLLVEHIYVCIIVAVFTTLVEAGCPNSDNFVLTMAAGFVYNHALKIFNL